MQGIIAFDVGGVIIDPANDKTDTSFFGDNYLQTSEVPGALNAVTRIVRERFTPERACIVSKCGHKTQRRTMHWLDHRDAFQRTGIAEQRAFFCRQRHEKAAICQRCGVTHMVDDRYTVHQHLKTVPHRILFKPNAEELRLYHASGDTGITLVSSWDEVLDFFRLT